MVNLKKWFRITLLSILFGFIIGYLFLWIWFFIRIILLGYKDSGPSWVNILNDVVFWGTMGISIVLGQLVFIQKKW
jgi:hypothetical protein